MKNPILKRLTSFGLSILLFFLVLLPMEGFASYDMKVNMTVGETKELTSATYSTFTYQWTIESGSDVISIESGASSESCKIKAEKEGKAVLQVVYTRSGFLAGSYTTKYDITVSLPSYTVTLDANGGYVNPSKVKVKDMDVITLPTPSRNGYNFLGWFTKATGGNEIHSGKKVHITGDTKLYAHWEKGKADPAPAPSSPSSPSDPHCPSCIGVGTCSACFGDGHVDCSNCYMGKCTQCGGTGQKLSYSMGGLKSKACTYCRGSGSCSRCGGIGVLRCAVCLGNGRCSTCNGTGFKPGRSLYS